VVLRFEKQPVRNFDDTPKESPPNSAVRFVYPNGTPSYWPEKLGVNIGGRTIILDEYLPRGTDAKLAPRWGMAKERGVESYGLGAVLFSVEKIERDPRELLGLLHEIGHARVEATHGASYHKKHNDARGKKDSDLTLEDKNMIIQNERDAWSEALKVARDMRDTHGVDIFSFFESKEDVMLFLRKTGLDSYEKNLHFADESIVERIMRYFQPRRGLSKDFL
jgi:hypothetical protein